MKQVGDSPFLKRVLIPFWVVRILVMVVEIGLYGLTIGVVSASRGDLQDVYDQNDLAYSIDAVIAILCVVEAIILLCLILDLVSIIKRARRSLTPRFFLITNVIQTTFWLVMFILSMLGAKTALGVILNIICLLSFVGLLIYASVVFHRSRKANLRGTYATAPLDLGDASHGLTTAYASADPLGAAPASYSSSYPASNPAFQHGGPQLPYAAEPLTTQQYYNNQPTAYHAQPPAQAPAAPYEQQKPQEYYYQPPPHHVQEPAMGPLVGQPPQGAPVTEYYGQPRY